MIVQDVGSSAEILDTWRKGGYLACSVQVTLLRETLLWATPASRKWSVLDAGWQGSGPTPHKHYLICLIARLFLPNHLYNLS